MRLSMLRLLLVFLVGCGTASDPADAGSGALTLTRASPDIQITGGPVSVLGENIHDPALAPGSPAVGTTVELVLGAETLAVSDVSVGPPSVGLQTVQITVPDRAGTTFGPREVVELRVTYDGDSDTTAFEYDDP